MQENKADMRITMGIIMVASFITPFTSSSINLAIPSIGLEFSGNQFWLNWVVFSYLLTSSVFLLPFGRIADIYGRKKIFIIGMALFALTSLACALANSLPLLVFFRVLQGLASAMIFGTSMAILISVAPANQRGKAIGINAAAVYLGLSLGPVLGGLICRIFNWRGVFYFILLLSLTVITLSLWKLKGEWKGANSSFDLIGCLLYILGLTSLLYGLADLTSGLIYVICFFTGIILLILFIYIELKVAHPLLSITLFSRNKVFAFSNLAALINYSATFALVYILSLYLQTVLGIETSLSGLILLAQPIMMSVFSPIAGTLSDRIEPRLVASLGMGITALGLFFFIFLGNQISLILFILNLAFIGLGLALFSSPNNNAIMSSVGKEHYGVASSILGTMRLTGQSLSMTIVALVTSIIMRDLTITSSTYIPSLLTSMRILFIIFTVLSIGGIFSSLARGNMTKKVDTPVKITNK